MPPDNSATIAPGTDVSFPEDGPNSGSGITRLNNTSFNLTDIGTYQVLFQASIAEAGLPEGFLTVKTEFVTGVVTTLTLSGGTSPVSAHLTILRLQ